MRRMKLKTWIYPLIWVAIIVISLYLLIRFATISFFDESGQSDRGFRDAIFSTLVNRSMERSSLVAYNEKTDNYSATFPLDYVTDGFILPEFLKDKNPARANAEENILPVLYDNSSMINTAEYSGDKKDTANYDETEKKIMIFEIKEEVLGLEYLLTNGAVIRSTATGLLFGDALKDNPEQAGEVPGQLQIGYMEGEVYYNDIVDIKDNSEALETIKVQGKIEYTMEQLKDFNFLVRNFYIVDPATKVTEKLFDGEKLAGMDMTLKQENDKPQILIYHTHSQEAFADSRPGEVSDTVVGMGAYLKQILEEKYGYNVIHDTSCYDVVDGVTDRNFAYNMARKGVTKILEENPSIEVVIDLHRDGVAKRSTLIDGEETAQIMLFNGLSRDQNGPITRLDNPYLQDNLAFSLQLQLKSNDLYPGLFYRNYLNAYRYNMHLRPKCILMELGTYKNSVQSARNAMEPFAEVLDAVLQGK